MTTADRNDSIPIPASIRVWRYCPNPAIQNSAWMPRSASVAARGFSINSIVQLASRRNAQGRRVAHGRGSCTNSTNPMPRKDENAIGRWSKARLRHGAQTTMAPWLSASRTAAWISLTSKHR